MLPSQWQNLRNLTLKQYGLFSLEYMGVLSPWGWFLGAMGSRILGAAQLKVQLWARQDLTRFYVEL